MVSFGDLVPKILYFVRLLQICLASAVLVLVCYDGTHRGWWKNIDGALALGIITCIFTLIATLATVWIHHRTNNPFSGGSRLYTIARLGAEALIFLMWIGTATLLLRPKGGCAERVLRGADSCSDDGKKWKEWSDQPVISWDIATAFTFVEIVSFMISAVLVFLVERGSKVPTSGGVSYA